MHHQHWQIYGTEIRACFGRTNVRLVGRRRRRIQQLLKNCVLNDARVSGSVRYEKSGKPVLNGRYISITHSGNGAAAALANLPVGIDMQEPDDRLLFLYPKFMHPSEYEDFSTRRIDDLLRLWTAKESVYKWAGIPGLSLRRDIIIHPLKRDLAYAEIIPPGRSLRQALLKWWQFRGFTFCLTITGHYK